MIGEFKGEYINVYAAKLPGFLSKFFLKKIEVMPREMIGRW